MQEIGEREVPWAEKYRPQSLDDVIAQSDIVKTIKKFHETGTLPHLLFYGPAGVGKTSTILALSHAMFPTKSERSSMLLELNASDDRGIDTVRNEILTFASTRNFFSSAVVKKGALKLIILDEADSMTKDAQNALRRIIEKYTENVRFCIICNYLNKIIPAIQSRCTRYRFAPLRRDLMCTTLKQIADKEVVGVDEAALNAVAVLSEGDMRRSINILQSCALSRRSEEATVSVDAVYACVARSSPSDIKHMLKMLMQLDIATCYTKMRALQVMQGFALSDAVNDLSEHVLRLKLPMEQKAELIIEMAAIEYRLSRGASEKFQLSALIAAFVRFRNDSIPIATE